MSDETAPPFPRGTVTYPIRRQLGHRISEGKPGPPPDFAEARRRFNTYRLQQERANNPRSNWIAEADKRLGQLQWIVQRVDELQTEQDGLWRWCWKPDEPSPEQTARRDRMGRIELEVELVVESFYYVAWRFRQIMRNEAGFRKFDPRGIREVRNDLLEHPHASNPNFAYGRDLGFGPVIKPYGARDIPVHDDGLYVNAAEFLSELVPRLKRATGEPK